MTGGLRPRLLTFALPGLRRVATRTGVKGSPLTLRVKGRRARFGMGALRGKCSTTKDTKITKELSLFAMSFR